MDSDGKTGGENKAADDKLESNTSKGSGGDNGEEIMEEDVIEVSDEDEDVVQVAEVLIELDDNLKSKLVADLMQICEVDENNAKHTLEAYQWNMQKAIDFLLYANESGESDSEPTTEEKEEDKPKTCSFPGESAAVGPLNIFSPQTDGKKEKDVEMERTSTSITSSPGFSSWAPEKFSVLSWNLDGLDDKNLEKRTDSVISLVEREKHDVLFFQELLPYTFDYIARRLLPFYKPVPGTEDSRCDYLTATFLRKNSVFYEDHYVVPYPNTAMGRTLLVTKAFIGQAKLALLNTHLESTAEFSAQRTQQLKTCFEIASGFDKEYNVIFGGDLNLRDKEVGGNLPTSMCDLWVQCGSRATCQYTWDLTRNTNKQMPSKFQPRCRFDRLYFKNSEPVTLQPKFFGVTGIEKVSGTQSFPSDHWAIISFFDLEKEARKPSARKRRAGETGTE